MITLGIETSCDETAAAVADAGGRILASVVASQLDLHAEYGGVVPELASRQHQRDVGRTAAEALRRAGVDWDGVEGVAATCGPGLLGALLVGLSWAKAAAFARGLPFVGVNHLEGHLVAAELGEPALPSPYLGLIASGGHTNLYLVPDTAQAGVALLAQTRDDAVGEAFDKVAKILGLSYPGGPAVQRAAEGREAGGIRFSPPRMKDGSADFSYSGLKTAVRYAVEDIRRAGREPDVGAVAAAFERTIVADLVNKTLAAAERHAVRGVTLTGGVAANRRLRDALGEAARRRGLVFKVPAVRLCTDNAAMIAAAGARRLAAGERHGWNLPADPRAPLGP